MLSFVSVVLCTDFAAALANPIAYLSSLEKHSQQLAILEDVDIHVKQFSAATSNSVCYLEIRVFIGLTM